MHSGNRRNSQRAEVDWRVNWREEFFSPPRARARAMGVTYAYLQRARTFLARLETNFPSGFQRVIDDDRDRQAYVADADGSSETTNLACSLAHVAMTRESASVQVLLRPYRYFHTSRARDLPPPCVGGERPAGTSILGAVSDKSRLIDIISIARRNPLRRT